jgi:opacity protein-like surface antigen
MRQLLASFNNFNGPQSVLRKVLLQILVSLPALVMLPLPAEAQSGYRLEHAEWEMSVFYGGSFIGSRTQVTPVENSPSRSIGLRYASGYMMGASVSENRWDHWGAVLEYSFSNQPMTFTNLSDSIPSLSVSQSIHRFSYDILYYPRGPHQRLRPYVFGGPGVALFYVKGPSKDFAAAQGINLNDPWKLAMNWGGGIKYLVKDHAAASIQFTDSISGVPGYGLPESGRVGPGGYVPGFRPDGLMNNWLVSVGFNYQWQKR